MIRCVKLWTGADRKSHFEGGFIDLEPGARGDALSARVSISSASFHESTWIRNSVGTRTPLDSLSSR
jgi:hypothetical protein